MSADNWDRAMRLQAIRANDAARGQSDIRRSITNESAGIGGDADWLVNAQVDMGGDLQRDKSLLEVMYAKFWAAGKIVDLKPNDAFAGGITWTDGDPDDIEAMRQSLRKLNVMRQALRAVKASRVYGTAIIIIAPTSGNFLEPLDPDNMEPGSISHLMVVDRFSLDDVVVEGNPANPRYGLPIEYRWNYSVPQGRLILPEDYTGSYFDVHYSRCIRFDAIPPITDDGWEHCGDDRWGQSVLVRAIEDIAQDKILNAAMGEVVKRASVPIIQMRGFRELLARGKGKKNEPTPEDYAKEISKNITSANLLFLDHEDKFGKLELHTAGLLEIVQQQAQRMAMIEGIPITRFTGQSASGLTATGEGDAKDWRITVDSYRKENIDPQVENLIDIVARDAGLTETPDWEWGRLGEVTQEETAAVAKAYAETTVALVQGNIIDETEARELMNNSELFDLDEDWTPPPLEVLMKPEPSTKGNPQRPSRPVNLPPAGGAKRA